MDEVFADEVNVEIRILHAPDLAGGQRRGRDSTLLMHKFQGTMMPELAK